MAEAEAFLFGWDARLFFDAMEEDRKKERKRELEVKRSRTHTKRGGEGLRMRKTGVSRKKTEENGFDLTLGLYKWDF